MACYCALVGFEPFIVMVMWTARDISSRALHCDCYMAGRVEIFNEGLVCVYQLILRLSLCQLFGQGHFIC